MSSGHPQRVGLLCYRAKEPHRSHSASTRRRLQSYRKAHRARYRTAHCHRPPALILPLLPHGRTLCLLLFFLVLFFGLRIFNLPRVRVSSEKMCTTLVSAGLLQALWPSANSRNESMKLKAAWLFGRIIAQMPETDVLSLRSNARPFSALVVSVVSLIDRSALCSSFRGYGEAIVRDPQLHRTVLCVARCL